MVIILALECFLVLGFFVVLFVCLFVWLVLVFRFWFFRDRVSLFSPGCPETHFVDQGFTHQVLKLGMAAHGYNLST